MPVYGYYVFPKPSVPGFPTAADPADRSCRYLVQPPTVPGLARLWGYQRPPRGGRGRCRRACERTPLLGRRRCAAGGRPFTAYIGNVYTSTASTRVGARVDRRIVATIAVLTRSHLPRDTMTGPSLPTPPANCDAAAVTVAPPAPPHITCVEPCAPVPAASCELPPRERPACHDDDAHEFDHLSIENPPPLWSGPRKGVSGLRSRDALRT